jgi:hypothetical protein
MLASTEPGELHASGHLLTLTATGSALVAVGRLERGALFDAMLGFASGAMLAAALVASRAGPRSRRRKGISPGRNRLAIPVTRANWDYGIKGDTNLRSQLSFADVTRSIHVCDSAVIDPW